MGKFKIVSCCLLLISFQVEAQRAGELMYEPNSDFPFGRPNPEAPEELQQFHFLVGKNDCVDERLNNATGVWDRTERTWDARYFMNGFTIIDGGTSNGNLRVYDQVTNQWQVHFYTAPVVSTGVWTGNMEGESMVLKKPQKAPGTDIDGVSRLTFSNISEKGFDWTGEWVSEDGSFVVPFWRISCQKLESANL